MGFLDYFDLDTLLFRAVAFVILITLHDAALAGLARLLGDRTAAQQGRLSLNPVRHLDPLGSLMVLFGPYGWSRPIPVDGASMGKNAKRKAAAVYAAGPVFYFVAAMLSGWLFLVLPDGGGVWLSALGKGILHYISIAGTLLFILNLIPIYPMDARHLVRGSVSGEAALKTSSRERWGLLAWVALFTLPFGRSLLEMVYKAVNHWITSAFPI